MPPTKTARPKTARTPTLKALKKSPTGIDGLVEITGGGLPTGRPTLISGGAGNQIREFLLTNDGVHLVEWGRPTCSDRMVAAQPRDQRKR